MTTFAVPPLHLPPTRRLPAEPRPTAASPAEAVEAAALGESYRPVSATSRDLTIPDIVPHGPTTTRRRFRGRAS